MFISDRRNSRWLSTADGMQRTDGLCVQQSLGSCWVILPQDRSIPPLYYCPCCDSTIDTMEAAMAVADAVYPSPTDTGADSACLGHEARK
jgi:hypothetical protein